MLLLGIHTMDSTEEKVKIEGSSVRHVENCLRRWKYAKQYGCSLLIL